MQLPYIQKCRIFNFEVLLICCYRYLEVRLLCKSDLIAFSHVPRFSFHNASIVCSIHQLKDEYAELQASPIRISRVTGFTTWFIVGGVGGVT